MGYRLLLLGPPVILRGTETVTLKSRKGQALLWYLASHPARMFPREHLYSLLWDRLPADSARRDFNTMFSRLRAQLPPHCLLAVAGQLGWNPENGMETDLAEFLDCLERGGLNAEGARPQGRPSPEEEEALRRAVALWRGTFLEGFSCDSAAYDDWLNAERSRWEMRVTAALARLVEAERAQERWDQVLSLARMALDIDPLQEPFHRAAMEALYRQGNRSAALAQFERCRKILLEQLGAEPEAATIALAETIRGAAAGTEPAGAAVFPGARPDPAAAPEPPPGGAPRSDGPPGESSAAAAKPRSDSYQILGLTRIIPPLVGRSRELEQVASAIGPAARWGPSHMVLLEGEAGIGKTRLLAEIIDLAERGALADVHFPTVLLGRAYESMSSVPYAVFVDLLASAVSAPNGLVAPLPDIWLRELGRLLPDIYVHRPDLYPPWPMESADDRLRLFQAVARLLGSLPQPVLLAVDDLQWSDPLTVSLLHFLLRQPPTQLRLAVIAAVREGDDTDALRHALHLVEREGRLTRVPLTNLTEEATLALVQSLSPAGGPLPARRIYAQTLGHPLYTVELVAMLLQGEAERRADEAATASGQQTPLPGDDPGADRPAAGGAAGSGSAPLPVPSTVQNLVLDRLARLGPAAMEVVEALAVFGRGATLDQLTRVTEMPEAQVVAALGALARAAITVDASPAVSFRHDLLRQVVLDRLPPSRRAYRHRQAYAVLAAQLPDPTAAGAAPHLRQADPQLLASLVAHAIGGELWKAALRWARQAAAVAESVYAFAAAVEYLKTARYCLAQLPETDENRREQLEIELDMARLDRWSPPAERDRRLEEAMGLAHAIGALDIIPRLQIARAESLTLQGRCLEAAALLEELAPLADREPRLALGFHAWKGGILSVTGDLREAIEHLSRVRAAMGDQIMKPGWSIHGGLANCWAAAGNWSEAEAALDALQREEQALGYDTLTSKFLVVAATVAYLRGQWREAADLAQRGLRAARIADDPYNEALCALLLGASLLELAEAGTDTAQEEGAEMPATDAITLAAGAKTPAVDAKGSAEGAETAREAGGNSLEAGAKCPPEHAARGLPPATPEQALQILQEALAASERSQSYTRRDFIYAFLAVAYARTGDMDKARAAVQAGLTLAARFGYKEGRAMCIEAEGRIAAHRGDWVEARERLNAAIAAFAALGNVAGVQRCRWRLAELQRFAADAAGPVPAG